MADNRAWTAGRMIARELEDLNFVFASRDAVTLKVDEAASMIVFQVGYNELWVPIRKGKISEAQALARLILREKQTHFPAVKLYEDLFAMIQRD